MTPSGVSAGNPNPKVYALVVFSSWEVLNGVGVDGVGGIFPFLRFFAFLRFSSLLSFSSLFSYSPSSPRGQGQMTAIYCNKKGEFRSDPVCTDPVPNFPIFPDL